MKGVSAPVLLYFEERRSTMPLKGKGLNGSRDIGCQYGSPVPQPEGPS